MRQVRATSKLLIAPFLVLLVVLPFVATRSYAASVISNTSSFTLALKPNYPNSFLLQNSNELNKVTAMIDDANNATRNSLPLGWQISAIVHEIIALHKEEVENITLVRRLFLNETKNLRLQLINETRVAIKLQMQNMTQEMERVREEYLAGNITKEEYLMQMLRLRLRFREEISKLKTLEKEIQNLNKKISEENKELAKNLTKINKDFAEQMKEVHEEIERLVNATKRIVQQEKKNMTQGFVKPSEQEENKTQGMGKPWQGMGKP
jgi:methyl-accepting chemotaxis protein